MVDTRKSPSGKLLDVSLVGYAPLQARYVDYRDNGIFPFDVIPTADQDGSAAFPYDNLQAAVDSIPQKSEPSLILLLPGDTSEQARKDVDISAYSSMHIKGLNISGQGGFAQVGNILATTTANIALEDLEVESLAANPAGSVVFLRGGGVYSDLTCQFLSFSGQAKANTLGVYAMQIIDAVVSSQMVGSGAEIADCTALDARINACATIGGILTLTHATGPSFFNNCDTLSVTAPALHVCNIDSWTSSNAPGFTTFTGPTPVVL